MHESLTSNSSFMRLSGWCVLKEAAAVEWAAAEWAATTAERENAALRRKLRNYQQQVRMGISLVPE